MFTKFLHFTKKVNFSKPTESSPILFDTLIRCWFSVEFEFSPTSCLFWFDCLSTLRSEDDGAMLSVDVLFVDLVGWCNRAPFFLDFLFAVVEVAGLLLFLVAELLVYSLMISVVKFSDGSHVFWLL